jgi:AcrR family transcriptional regulator
MDGIEVVRRPPFGGNPLVGERGTKTQQRILRASLRVFAEVGYHATRVELITAAAGCSRPTFYQYFSSKEDVFSKLTRQVGAAMLEMARRLDSIDPDADGIAVLRQWLREFADLYDDYSPVFSEFSEAMRDDTTLASGSASISAWLGQALTGSVDAPEGALDADELGHTLVTMIVRCNLFRRASKGALDIDRFTDGLAQLVHRVLLGPIPGVNMAELVPASLPLAPEPSVVPESPRPVSERNLRPQGENMRQRLLDAGAVVIPRRGYYDTRVDDIVEEAGASHGSFYRYFENREELFVVLAEEASAQMVALIEQFPATLDAALLRAWLQNWFRAYSHRGAVLSAWQETAFSDPGIGALSLRISTDVLGRLMRVLERRGFGDTVVDSFAFLSLTERIPYCVMTVGHSTEAEAIEAMLIIMRRGFMGVPIGA